MAVNESKPKPIFKLDQNVINKICAGEVIHRPLNVVKELVENSLDAGATSIMITLKNGGLKSIIIQDNGCGIRKDDLEIVCCRFTTSKLNNMEDLNSLSTFGFRGEALSSISTVSNMTIITKTRDNICGYKAEFLDGKLKENSSITQIAANEGTTIIIENLFYNMPTRKAALSSESFEFNIVQEMISKYSVLLSQKCAFILKKHGENNHAVNTKLSNSTVHNINILFGQQISSYLIPIKLRNDNLGFKIEGYFSNNDLTMKKFYFLLFINSRLVECSSFKKSLKDIYKKYLMKGGNPFIYLSLEIDPGNIDVNVHPTKNEVCFLYQNEIIDDVLKFIEYKLQYKEENIMSSQNFNTSQSLFSTFKSPINKTNLSSSINKKVDESDDSIISKDSQKASTLNNFVTSTPKGESYKKIHKETSIESKSNLKPSRQIRTDSKAQRIDQYLNLKQKTCKKRRKIELTSLKTLRNEIFKSVDQDLFDIITKSTYIGVVDENYALIQHELNCLLINIPNLNRELFYQIFLLDFGNFDYIKFKEPLSISKLLTTYFKVNASIITKSKDQIEEMVDLIISRRIMLDDYFSIKINENTRSIESIPTLVTNYTPVISYIPDFIYRLINNVDWENEKNCFATIGNELANFYCRTSVAENEDQIKSWSNLVENILYPLYKTLLFPSANLKDNNSFHCITNITSLYKVFERC